MKKLLALLMAVIMVFAFAACNGNNAKDDTATSYEGLSVAMELTSEEYGIGFRKGSDLTEKVNSLIAELKDDGTLTALAEKYELTLAEGDAGESKEATVKDIDYIKNNGKMIIGITDYEPMNYKDDNGEWTGFDTEFALAVCEKLGVTAEFVEIDWDNKFIALESKAIDCIWNGMTISDEVLKNTNCSVAYVKNAQVVVMSEEKVNPEMAINTISTESKYLELSVPKFRIEYSQNLADAVKELGINKAFTPDIAEFTGMFTKSNMWITSLMHKTYISVDEEGTEAAAVTAAGMAGNALPPEPVLLKFNKPFYFVIRDNVNDETLFIGSYAFANN